MVLESFFDSIFGSLITWNPLYALIIISFVLMLMTTLVYKYFTDQEAMKSLKAEMKEIQAQMKESKEDAIWNKCLTAWFPSNLAQLLTAQLISSSFHDSSNVEKNFFK